MWHDSLTMTHLDAMIERCRDLNECFLETHNCNEHATCTNSIGSFECTCNEGFSGNGTTCEDNDECSTGGYFLLFINDKLSFMIFHRKDTGGPRGSHLQMVFGQDSKIKMKNLSKLKIKKAKNLVKRLKI